jgi:hypothetical protein
MGLLRDLSLPADRPEALAVFFAEQFGLVWMNGEGRRGKWSMIRVR